MPITTMWLSRSSSRRSDCSRSICSTISPVVRLRVRPSRPLAQNTQPMPQPTCVLMQMVRRISSRRSTHSIWPPSASVSSSFSVPSSACVCRAIVALHSVKSRASSSRSACDRFVISLKVSRPLLEQPLPHLADAILALTVIVEPRRELLVDCI